MAVDFNDYSIDTLRALKDIKDKISMHKNNIDKILQEIRDNYNSMKELKETLAKSQDEYNEISSKGSHNITASEESRQSVILDEGIELKEKIRKLEDIILNLNEEKENEEELVRELEDKKSSLTSSDKKDNNSIRTDFYNGKVIVERNINASFTGNHSNNKVGEVDSHREINALRRTFFMAPKEALEVSPELKDTINRKEDIVFLDIFDNSRIMYLKDLKRKQVLNDIEKEISNITNEEKETVEVSLKPTEDINEPNEEVTENVEETNENVENVTPIEENEEAVTPINIETPQTDEVTNTEENEKEENKDAIVPTIDSVVETEETEIDINNDENNIDIPVVNEEIPAETEETTNVEVPQIEETPKEEPEVEVPSIAPITIETPENEVKDEPIVPIENVEKKEENVTPITPLESADNIFANATQNVQNVTVDNNKLASIPKTEEFMQEANFIKNKVASTTKEKEVNILSFTSEPNNKLTTKLDANGKIVNLINSNNIDLAKKEEVKENNTINIFDQVNSAVQTPNVNNDQNIVNNGLVNSAMKIA